MTEFRVHEANLDEFEAKIEKANRRLARHGIDGRFEATRLDEQVLHHEDGSIESIFTYEFNAPTFEYNGWEFLATIQLEEGGTIMRIAPGKELPRGYERPDTHTCEHCGVRRFRTRSYIVRSTETGEIKQIGHNCIDLFLGVQVKGIWALGWLPELGEGDDDWDRPARSWAPTRWAIDYVLRVAYAVTDGGRGFVSRATARDYEKPASADLVGNVLTFRPTSHTSWEYKAYIEGIEAAANALDQQIVDTLLAYPTEMGDGDYAENLRVLTRGTTLDYTNLGLLTSLVGVWRRAQEKDAERQREAERRAAKTNEWVGKEKDRLRGLELTVVLNRQWNDDFGTKTMLLFEDTEGRTFKWVASRWLGYDAGDKLRITGTVKALDTYNGIKQTVLTRCKIDQELEVGER